MVCPPKNAKYPAHERTLSSDKVSLEQLAVWVENYFLKDFSPTPKEINGEKSHKESFDTDIFGLQGKIFDYFPDEKSMLRGFFYAIEKNFKKYTSWGSIKKTSNKKNAHTPHVYAEKMDALFDGWMDYLDALLPHKPMLHFLIHQHACDLKRHSIGIFWEHLRRIYRFIGASKNSSSHTPMFNDFFHEQRLFFSLYGTIFPVWVDDTTPDHSKTMGVLLHALRDIFPEQ